MCRFAAYLGHSLRLSQLLTEPENSLIRQSYQARERPEPLNGDGFGVAWFVPDVSSRPALFKDITPAWNNENLVELARVTSSRCILAHVRAASPQSTVQRLNCHPFVSGNLAFMHNGYMAGFARWRRRLLAGLSDAAFEVVRGSTDSEHAFAVLWDEYLVREGREPAERLLDALRATVQRLEDLRREAGVEESSYFNFAIGDGENLAATRFASRPQDQPASLHYLCGRNLRCESGRIQLDVDEDRTDLVLIASEEMEPGYCWSEVPHNHLVLAQHPGRVQLLPMEQAVAIS